MELVNLEKLLKEKLSELSYELVNLSLNVVKGEKTLVVVVDRVEPIDMDAIVDLSHKLNEYIDEIDPIEGGYTLDISSLGAEKPLKVGNLKDYIGSYIHLHMINPVDGYNIIEGELESVDENTLSLSYKVKTRVKHLSCELKNIYKIRLAIKF